jgi:hypothetical protein
LLQWRRLIERVRPVVIEQIQVSAAAGDVSLCFMLYTPQAKNKKFAGLRKFQKKDVKKEKDAKAEADRKEEEDEVRNGSSKGSCYACEG